MTLSLQELQSVMAPLASLGHAMSEFEVNGLKISLRSLKPSEENEVQRYAREAVVDGNVADHVNALDFLDRFRICALSYSIMRVGDTYFDGVEYIETGEKLPNGVSVKVKKSEALITILGTWSREMVNVVFRKFTEVQGKAEAEVDGLIEFDEVDYDSEISRLETRIQELKDEKAKHDLSKKDPRIDMRNRVLSGRLTEPTESPQGNPEISGEPPSDLEEYDTVLAPSPDDIEYGVDEGGDLYQDELEDGDIDDSDDTEDVFEDKPVETPQPAKRPSLIDRASGGMVRSDPVRTPPQEPKQSFPADKDMASDTPFDDVASSMVDTEDPDAMQAAIEAENARALTRRAAYRSAAPHLAAKQVADAMQGDFDPPASRPTQGGKIDGIDVYKMPTQTMTDRKPPAKPKIETRTTSNPKFKPLK